MTAATKPITFSNAKVFGRRFNADYIVRGRILEYKTREDPTWEPWKKGFLPFLLQGTSRIAVGVAARTDTTRLCVGFLVCQFAGNRTFESGAFARVSSHGERLRFLLWNPLFQ